MEMSTCIGTWQEALCPDLRQEISVESFEELLEGINLGEKINSKYTLLAEWVEEYYWTAEAILQPVFRECSNPYSLTI